MNRRQFLKHLPIVATLPFLPALPESPTIQPDEKLGEIRKLLELSKGFARLEVEFRAILERQRQAGISAFGESLTASLATHEGDVFAGSMASITEGIKDFVASNSDPVGEAKKLEKGLEVLLVKNNLYKHTKKRQHYG